MCALDTILASIVTFAIKRNNSHACNICKRVSGKSNCDTSSRTSRRVSRLGAFKLTPVTAEEKIVSRISLGLNEVKLIEAGKLPAKDAKSFLDEL